jgi:hypothetical protein
MIDLAIIAGTPHLHDLSARGSIDMALTHLVLDHPAYADYFQARSATGAQILLDNSAYELETHTGHGLPATPVLAAARRIGATVVICQDVLYDGPATVAATRRFLDDAAGGPYRLMAVPQGCTRGEWLDCYHQLVDLPGIDMIGLSKLSVPRCFNAPVAEARLDCVQTLRRDHVRLPLHLLGGDRSLPWELAEHRRRSNDTVVVSNDSSFAFWYPATDTPVHADSGRAAAEAPGKPDLTGTRLTRDQLRLAERYVSLLREAAGLDAGRPAGQDERAA